MRKKLCGLTALLLVISLLLCACSNATDVSEETKESMPVNIMQKSDPAKDDTLNVLMIGSSFCYYYVEELYGLAKAAGIKMRVCNVYQSGCTLEQHYTWWKNGEANYFYYTTDENGRKEVKNTNLEYCLSQHNWDVISLQQSTSKVFKTGVEAHYTYSKTHLDDLWSYIKAQYPMSRHLWHSPWSYQIGYDRGGYQMLSIEQQEENVKLISEFSDKVCEDYVLEQVNTGKAWQVVRQNGYDNLCARLGVEGNLGDDYHDGDIGGGQYLNACVWFEVITGQSCVGNTYRPDYALDANITFEQLQEAAHKAVESLKG